MLLLLTTNFNGSYTAAVGTRPACVHKHFAEVGNLVATQKGASQLLYLILTSVIKQSSLSNDQHSFAA